MRRGGQSTGGKWSSMERRLDLTWDDKDVFPGRIYPDTAFLFQRMEEKTLNQVSPQPGERVVDMGCGRAADAVKLARCGGQVTGLDPSGIMMRKAKGLVEESSTDVALVQGVGESLPFRSGSLDKVVCKGALDHFADVAKTMEEVARVLKPGGEAIFAVANFEGLSSRLSRALCPLIRYLYPRWEPLWQVPEDHNYRFDYPMLKGFASEYLQIKEAIGVSLLWGAPFWGVFLKPLPTPPSNMIMGLLDRLAHHLPQISDVIIIKCTPRSTR